MRKEQYGYNREEDTPVPMPNTEVKLFIADGTQTEGSWESRSQPIVKKAGILCSSFLF